MATYAKKVWTKEETAAFNQKRNEQKEAERKLTEMLEKKTII